MPQLNDDHARIVGDNTVVNGHFCFGRGRNCTLNGNGAVLYGGDGSTINGNMCTVFCRNPATVTDNGQNNRIIVATATRFILTYDGAIIATFVGTVPTAAQ